MGGYIITAFPYDHFFISFLVCIFISLGTFHTITLNNVFGENKRYHTFLAIGGNKLDCVSILLLSHGQTSF